MQKGLIFLFIFLLTIPMAFGGQIRMSGTPAFILRTTEKGLILEGNYTLANSGDERAKDVFPKIILDSFETSGKALDLDAGEKNTWSFREEIPFSKFSKLPLIGQFLIRFENHYTDMNSYPFAVPQMGILVLDTPGDSAPQTEMAMKIKKVDDELYQAEYEVHNKLMDDMNVQLNAVLPQEAQITSGVSPVFLKEQASLFASFQFKNIKGLQGSRYYAYLTAQWENSGKRYANWVSAPFTIGQADTVVAEPGSVTQNIPKDKIFWSLWSVFALLGSVIIWRYWVLPLRKIKK